MIIYDLKSKINLRLYMYNIWNIYKININLN